MSHFLVGVFCVDTEDVDKLLAPYDEENTNYFEFEEDENVSLEELKAEYEADEEKGRLSFEEWLLHYDGLYLCNGKVGYRSNPNAKWDWYDADGGRWAKTGLYQLKEGEKPDEWNRVKVKQMDFSPNEAKRREAGIFWDDYVEGRNPKKVPFPEWKPEYYLETYGTKEFYADYCAHDKRPHAFITPDGEWHEQGTMGWFGISTSKKETIAQNMEEWEQALQDYQGLYLVYVDCHI